MAARHAFLRLALWVVRPLAGLLYRVRVLGGDQVPRVGGALIVSNHLSYADPFLLQLACRRPIRFLGDAGLGSQGIASLGFRLGGVIPLSPRRPLRAVRLAVRALERGEVVCVFAEGGLSRTGTLMRLEAGYAVIARQSGAPVIPASIDGIWGSVFSFAGRRYFWKSPRLMPTEVGVAFGAPIPAAEAGQGRVRDALLDLGAWAFATRPSLERHLGRETIRSLARRPGRVVAIDCVPVRRATTAAEILAAAAVLARRIRTGEPGRRVGIVLPPGGGAMIANLAVVCAGKVPVNLNFTVARASAEAALRIGGISTVITAAPVRARFASFPWPERTLDLRTEIEAGGGRRAVMPWFLAAWVLPNQWIAGLLGLPRLGGDAEASLIFSSGSAGEPKGVVLTHRNILGNAAQIASTGLLPPSVSILACLPVFHSFGQSISVWYALLGGWRVVAVPSPLDSGRILEAIREEAASVFVGAPSFVRPFLKKAHPGDLRSLELLVTGAEKLPDEVRTGFLEAFHVPICEGYGLTETSPVASVNQPDPPVTTRTADPQQGRRPGTVGRLLPGMTARIADPETEAWLPAGRTGVLWLRGSNVFPGYLDDGAANRAAFRDGWFVTGDLGSFDEDGFLTIEGRLSRFSKVGGEMVPHGAIEQAVAAMLDPDPAGAPRVAVVGLPDAAKGEVLVLIAAVDMSLDAVRGHLLAKGFPNLWIPRFLHRVDAVPMLGSGKLDLRACRRLAEEAIVAARAP